jgi:hypothetical protein
METTGEYRESKAAKKEDSERNTWSAKKVTYMLPC